MVGSAQYLLPFDLGTEGRRNILPDKNILVVEDNADTRMAMRTLLEGEGYRVNCAANGQEALECLRQGEIPCVILMDPNMPVMDGQKFHQELLRDPDLAPIPIVVISGMSDLPQIAASLGAEGYHSKPVAVGWLLEIVRRVCA